MRTASRILNRITHIIATEERVIADNPIRFDDGAAYERYMGKWSQLVAELFLDWLASQPGLRWLDVGCGNGAFTEIVAGRLAPASVSGIDPSEAQLAFARARPRLASANFRLGDAMAEPFPDNAFNVSVMPLVIFFVPVPAQGVAEMVRVTAPGGSVAAYAWDMVTGGFPYAKLHAEMRAMGVRVPEAPNPDASGAEAMRALWTGAGLERIEGREITVQRTFVDFEDYWTTVQGGPSVSRGLAGMSPGDLAQLKARMRALLPADSSGRITYSARANAIKGRVSRSKP